MSTLLSKLDMDTLSPRSRAILIRIVQPITEGWKETELAAKLGRTPSWVSERLNELKQEILLQNGVFPPLSDNEFAALRADIEHRGVLMPVLVDEQLRIIDGRHRLLIAEELGINCPYIILDGLTDDERHEISIALNAARRQMNRLQRRKLIEFELMRNPARSDRRIAAICGVHSETVGVVRSEIGEAEEALRATTAPGELEDGEQPSLLPESGSRPPVAPPIRIDARGAQRPAPAPRAQPAAPTPIATLTCPGCDTELHLYRADGRYTLEHQTD